MADLKSPLLGKERMARSLRDQAETIEGVDDPFARRSLRVAYHLRRYAAIYVIGALGVLALAILPSVGGGKTVASGGTGSGAYGPGGATGDAANNVASQAAGGPAGAAAASASGGTGLGGAAGVGGSGKGGPIGAVQVGTGVTVGGVPCKPGVAQLPFSLYADPCVAKFSGNNGGATWNGVTGDTITFALRHNSDSQGANSVAVNALVLDAGGVDPTTNETYVKALVAYFNKNFELYGRHVNLVDFNGQGNGNDENLGNGQAAACADADTVANSIHAFSDINFQGPWESDPFSQCAARYKIYIPQGALYYPESEYQSLDPYVWAITTSCTLGDQEAGEFIGKQMAPFPAKWAGADGPVSMQNTQRKFAVYVPNNAGHSDCAAGMIKDGQSKYHMASNRFDDYQSAPDIPPAPQDSHK